MKKNNKAGGALSRRDILRFGLGGCTVASIGFGFTLAGGSKALADVVADEAEKRANAEHIMTMGLDATLNQFPGRVGTPHMVWIHGAPEFKAAVEAQSGGRIYVEVHDGGSLGGQADLLKKVQQGVVQAGSCTTQNAAQMVPLLNVLDVPYAIGTDDDNFWRLLFSKEFNDTLRAATEQRRVTLAFTHPWRRMLLLSRNVATKVRLPEDLTGMKVRVTASRFEQLAFQILPTSATPIAWSETFSALKDGVMEGMHIGPGSCFDVGMAPVVGQIVDTDWMYNTDSIWVSTRWLDKLDPDLKEAVMEAAYLAQVHVCDTYETILRDTIGVMPGSPQNAGFPGAGTVVNFLTEEERAVWRDALSVEKNPSLQEAIDNYGRDAYEMVVKVAAGSGSPEPVRWWKL
ncbi:TRAP transporter substrate-binding protein [Pseudorhodobacter aquimaris]|uniref:TRAP transporter substrate-binding protein n=1 Tax=Pseudorhodobacter aquimaris TaxID=687412 RepID=UPI00067D6AA2|nr:TRAP transporter substrate-binding protein [Pseudorhodobacter aquimaris]